MLFSNVKIKIKLRLFFLMVMLFMMAVVAVGINELHKLKQRTVNLYAQHVKPLETLESVKADFARLRVDICNISTSGWAGEFMAAKGHVTKARSHYEKLKADTQTHLSRLIQANKTQAEMDAFNKIMTVVNDEYWPAVEAVNVSVMRGETAKMSAFEMNIINSLAESVDKSLCDLFDSEMAMSVLEIEKIKEVAEKRVLIMLITGVAGVVASFLFVLYISECRFLHRKRHYFFYASLVR